MQVDDKLLKFNWIIFFLFSFLAFFIAKSFTTSYYKSRSKKNMDCTICLECLELNHKETLTLECDHVFHEMCIKSWLTHGRKICPTCRLEVSKALLNTVFPDDPLENEEHSSNYFQGKMKKIKQRQKNLQRLLKNNFTDVERICETLWKNRNVNDFHDKLDNLAQLNT